MALRSLHKMVKCVMLMQKDIKKKIKSSNMFKCYHAVTTQLQCLHLLPFEGTMPF